MSDIMETEKLLKFKQICALTKGIRMNIDIEWMVSNTKDIKVFANLVQSQGIQALASVCQYLLYEEVQDQACVFAHGEVGFKFYIILDGKVSIQIPTNGDSNLTEIMSYESGASFGEVALETGKPRGATAVCRKYSHFLVIEKKYYKKYMQQLLSDNKHRIVNFLAGIPFFQHVSKIVLMKLTYNIKERVYEKGQIIFKEGEEAKSVFIIKQGECRICKYMSIDKIDQNIRSKKKLVSYTTKRLGVGGMMGEEDAIYNRPHSYTAICDADSSALYIISAKEFFIRLKAEESQKKLKEMSKSKHQHFEEWRILRSSLKDLFKVKTEEVVEKAKKVKVEFINNTRIKRITSDKKIICSRNNSNTRMDMYASQLNKTESISKLVRNQSAIKSDRYRKGVSVFSLNSLPMLEGLWTRKIENTHKRLKVN